MFVYFGTEDHQYLPENRRDYPVNFGSNTYVTADVDNDGYVELITTISNGVRIFKGTPKGPDPANYYDILHPAGLGVGGGMVGDFNHDGWLDLIMVPFMNGNTEKDLENSVFVYFGGPNGYTNKKRMVLPAFIGSALLADIDNDGYIDFLYGDGDGYIGVYYGGPDGFDKERFGRIYLKNYNGSLIGSMSVADIDNDGYLELFVTTAGHYSRLPSHIYVMKDGKNNFPKDKQVMYETGGTTGYPALANIFGSGNLDLLVPFYSTTETRELPARIFRGDDRGNFDWENPLRIECFSSIGFFPVDLTGNGYHDLFICCHRDNIGHMVNSKLIMNGSDGIDLKNVQDIPGYGPHGFTAHIQGNLTDRSENEYYTSPVFECKKPGKIRWQGETPFKTSIILKVRFGSTIDETLRTDWSEEIRESDRDLYPPEDTEYMQYQAIFCAPGLVNTPRLLSITIE